MFLYKKKNYTIYQLYFIYRNLNYTVINQGEPTRNVFKVRLN